MDKIHNYWQKIKAKNLLLAVAIGAGVAIAGSCSAPMGAHAVNFDKIELGDMVINDEYGVKTGNPEKNIYGEFQIAFQNTTNSSCDAAKTYWTNNNSHPSYKEAMIQSVVPQGTAPTSGTPKRLYWYLGRGASPNINAVNVFNNSPTGPDLNVEAAFNHTSTPTNRTQWNIEWLVYFQLTESSSNGNYFVGDGMYISVTCNNTTVSTRLGGAGWWWNNGSGNADARPVWIKNLTINWNGGPGETGPEIPSTYTPPIPPRNDVPNVILRGVNNWEGQFSDDNFLTFDAVPFTCDEGLAPVISGEVWDERTATPVLMDTFTANATGLFNIKFPKDTEDSDYRIVSWYVCDDGINVFAHAAHYEFTITGYGQLKTESLFETCMDASFPFIHPTACLENVFTVINLLYFDEVNIGGAWSAPDGCYQLTYIGHWINRPNQVVCPAVDPTVRVIITPFVIFLFALGALKLLNRNDDRRP